ncbi:hypothetical protein [Homoserinimonas sp. OAct 916]|uniref:hypothetical protein n=1 Tax=Homoserinimonas sp. OAct 916 TaxID=2211450 RepID=UPI001E3AEE63|nr:hypothetical protein [Homoserinimonas sp. OAct 916]
MAFGFTLGAALFGLLVAIGNPDWRSYLTAEEVVRSVAFYGLCGVGVAVASIVGSGISIVAVDRGIQRPPGVRVRASVVGAAAGALVLGVDVSASIALVDGSTS